MHPLSGQRAMKGRAPADGAGVFTERGGRSSSPAYLASGGLIALFVLSLHYYWFAVADRYAVFLYGHLGATPFDAVTSSRYWMSGLVASGAVMVLYGGIQWAWGRAAAARGRLCSPLAWWKVWLVAVAPLVVGIPAITMTANSPRLPAALAVKVTVASGLGLALALAPGAWAARRPRDLIWLGAEGLALVPGLLFIRALELPALGVGGLTPGLAGALALGSVAVGAFWLAVMTVLCRRHGRRFPTAVQVLAAGLCWSYLLLPLLHYVVETPWPYKYITTASNFFATRWDLQFLTFAAAVGLAFGADLWRRRGVRSGR